jgi:hypothetical protein
MPFPVIRGVAIALFLLSLVSARVLAQNDPIARLGRRIEAGQVQPRFDDERGWLPWLLETLDIPGESQMLVFSKTSIQGIHIGPHTPRMIFFNDAVALGTMRGGPIEVAAQDPDGGMMFYLVDQNPSRYREWAANPKRVSPFLRRPDCMNCHLSKTSGLAEMRLRSVVTASNGDLLERLGARETDGRTPLPQLFGGWFVTGRIDGPHMGNTVWDAHGLAAHIEPPGQSDIAALLVFEHQTRMMNLISQTRRAPEHVNELVDSLLFVDEAKLTGPVQGSSGFVEKFAARGPRDSKGRSLRDLDLNTRLLKYPCSYLIYSEAFDALPGAVKTAIYRRMSEVLATRGAEDRQAIVEILRDTKPDLPKDFR